MEASECWRVAGCIEAGQSITDVALFFGVHHSVISRLRKQFQTTQAVVRRPVGSRPKVTTSAEDRYIDNVAKRNRRATSTRVTSMFTASIVWVPLSVQSRGAHLKWCRERGNWTVSDWGNVMFTDESRFALEPDDKRIRIWRKQGTHNQSQNITEHHTFRGGKITVWVPSPLKWSSMTAVRYQNGVLESIMRLYAAAVGSTFVLIDDNARPYRADIVDDYQESEGIERMTWPAYSPDLNLIENLWDDLGRAVSSRFPTSATLIQLETVLQEEWRLLNNVVVDHLIESIVKRLVIPAVIGGYKGCHIPRYSIKEVFDVSLGVQQSMQLPHVAKAGLLW
ncbi:transposable element Tcb1 transposase [Trichonephila clavipes]|nr:transposable element Tcb1 transposase [Trichonephila clavipes]